MAAANETVGRGGRLAVLDGLRLVAALGVVAFHFTGRDSYAWGESVRVVFPTVSRFTIYGGFGPYLFFMISGFVVLMSAEGRSVPAFLGSRVGRLYPAYWLSVVVAAGVIYVDRALVPAWQNINAGVMGLNLSMFQSAFGVPDLDGVYWTLWVELKFYVLLALLCFAGITRGRLLGLCLGWPVAAALALNVHSDFWANLLGPYFAPFFCIGILLYLVYREGWSASVGLLLGMNFLFALWVCRAYYVGWSLAVAGAPVSFRGLAVLLTLMVAAMVVATMTPVARLRWRWLTVAGALTYPLYLMHQDLGWALLHALSGRMPAHVAVGLVVTAVLLLAYLVHRFIERPFGPRLRRAVERDLSSRLPDRRVPAAPPQAPLPQAQEDHLVLAMPRR